MLTILSYIHCLLQRAHKQCNTTEHTHKTRTQLACTQLARTRALIHPVLADISNVNTNVHKLDDTTTDAVDN